MPGRPFGCLAALIALAVAAVPARAQDYPTQPIRIIVSPPPGGLGDLVGRTLAQKLSESGKAAVVENRPGAAGAVGADAAAKSPPDGYTLYVAMHQTNAILPNLVAKLPYDAVRDFAPITNIAAAPNVLVVNSAVPANSMQELVTYAKANPGKLSFASQGNGSSGHIVGEQFKQVAGVDIVHVPYRGAAPAIQDLVAGHVSMMFDVVPLARAQIIAGKVRGLAVASPERVPALPDVPTMAEAGFPELEGGPWFGLAAPAGTPRPIIDWLNRETRKMFSAEDVRERFVSQGLSLRLGTPEEFTAHIAAERKRWGDIIRRAGIRME